MTRDEVIDLLTIVAATDKRTVGRSDVTLWCGYVGDLEFDDAKTAVIEHYRSTRDWLMPVDVRTRVHGMRTARMAGVRLEAPGVDPDDTAAYLAARRTQIAAVASGRGVRQIGDGHVG